jgi:hypothetical protein
MSKKDKKPDEYYYNENGLIVFTEKFHINRGFCCGNKCRHCPYVPKHIKGNKNTKKD